LDVVQVLVEHPSIEIEAVSTILRTPLHIAATNGFTSIARMLIDHGANPNCRDFDENTPLHCASEYGKMETILYLLKETKADPLLKNKFGYVPSDIAMNLQTRQVFETILRVNGPSNDSS
jgi:ankyrin repeat protein